ncbi:DUF6090 family protein [uncultured Croceitalea sp.]|uniref:DUF6090 family protein n=1 Tax=uncultured Croceitalea sp. TaxID=1798908 RepID=UPI003305C168
MIKFFRKIRHNLLSQGKTSTYLKYAIGEIILVVIGILIALQINNWSEQQKLLNQKNVLVNALLSDAHTTNDRLAFSIAMAKEIDQKLSLLLNILNNEDQSIGIDSIQVYGAAIFQVANFRPALSTYETSLSTGNVVLLENNLLLDQYIQFKDSYDWFKLHQNISGDIVYLGSVWELRKKLGTAKTLITELGDYPESYKPSNEEFIDLFYNKETYATFESMQWLIRNQLEALNRAKTANDSILRLLNDSKKNKE